MDGTVTLKELTEKLGLTPRRCQQLSKDGVFVKVGLGQYDLLQCAISYIAFLRRNNGSESEITLTLKDLARCTCQSPGNVLRLRAAGVFKTLSHGRYDLVTSMKNYVLYVENKKLQGRPRNEQLPFLHT